MTDLLPEPRLLQLVTLPASGEAAEHVFLGQRNDEGLQNTEYLSTGPASLTIVDPMETQFW